MCINIFLFITLTLLACNARSKAISPSAKASCVVEHNGQQLIEGDSIDVKGKLYKVEECALQRAYHACGTHLLFVMNIVCQAVEKQKAAAGSNIRVTRFARQKLLTDACCQSLCTVSEMTRYCPSIEN